MKRDWELVRTILLTVEEADPTSLTDEDDFKDAGVDKATLVEHVKIMESAGLLEAGYVMGGGFHVRRLTWEGHEFLEAIRAEGAMQQVREKAKVTGGALTFEMVKALGTAWLKSQMGLEP